MATDDDNALQCFFPLGWVGFGVGRLYIADQSQNLPNPSVLKLIDDSTNAAKATPKNALLRRFDIRNVGHRLEQISPEIPMKAFR